MIQADPRVVSIMLDMCAHKQVLAGIGLISSQELAWDYVLDLSESSVDNAGMF